MGLNWHFTRITRMQHARLLSEPESEVVEAIDEERLQAGLRYETSDHDLGKLIEDFESIYELILRTFFDDLEDLLLMDDDDGPALSWPLGDTGVYLPEAAGHEDTMFTVVGPDEVLSVAPMMQRLLDGYLDDRFERYKAALTEKQQAYDMLVPRYPEVKWCYTNLTRFVQTAAKHGEGIMWDYK